MSSSKLQKEEIKEIVDLSKKLNELTLEGIRLENDKNATIDERNEMDKENFDENDVEEVDDMVTQTTDENLDQEGFINNEDIEAEGEEDEDDLDNIQLNYD